MRGRTRGFTLVELMVAVSIFSVVAIVASVALLNMINVQEKTAALRAVNDNVNFALELMMREIRTGTQYCIEAGTCMPATNPDTFSFVSESGETIVYRLENGRIERRVVPQSFLGITSPDIVVGRLNFIVEGEAEGDRRQPRVTIILHAEAASPRGDITSTLDLQTTVSQREIDS